MLIILIIAAAVVASPVESAPYVPVRNGTGLKRKKRFVLLILILKRLGYGAKRRPDRQVILPPMSRLQLTGVYVGLAAVMRALALNQYDGPILTAIAMILYGLVIAAITVIATAAAALIRAILVAEEYDGVAFRQAYSLTEWYWLIKPLLASEVARLRRFGRVVVDRLIRFRAEETV